MPSKLNPYLAFEGNARDAIETYRDVFGGELSVNTFGDFGQAPPGFEDKIMHSQLETSAGFTLMASDTPPGMTHNPGTNITISLSGDDAADLEGWFSGLAEGGTVNLPLEKQMWGDHFGQLTDRFGISWLVNIAGDAVEASA